MSEPVSRRNKENRNVQEPPYLKVSKVPGKAEQLVPYTKKLVMHNQNFSSEFGRFSMGNMQFSKRLKGMY